MKWEAKLLLDARAELGEGPLWDEQAGILYWVDILGHRLHAFDPATGADRSFDLGQPVSAVGLRRGGGLLLALERHFAVFDPRSETVQRVAAPAELPPGVRFNDGKCDPAGWFWAGTMAYDLAPGAGTLYRLDRGGAVRPVIPGLTISNGLAWDEARGVMYHIDTIPRTVWAYDYDLDSGAIARRRVAWQVPEALGYPDGMTLDAVGRLWIAFFGGGCVRCWDPHERAIVHVVELPVSQVTACTFGGPDLHELYITTAWEHMTWAQRAAEPLAGGLFRARLDVPGLPAYRCRGE